MTVSSTASRWTYTGNGVTTAFSYGNLIFAASDLQVYVDGTLKLLTTDYAVSNVGLAAGGNVTFVTAPANGSTVLIARAVPATQAIDFVANQDLRADTLELGLDKATVLIQQILARFGRGLFLADGDAAAGLLALPPKSALAGKFLAFDATGEPIAAVPPAEGTPVSAFAETLLDDADAATALSTLGVSTYIKTVLDDTDASTAQTTLGISTYIKTLLDDADAATARTTLAAAPDTLPGFRNRLINGNFQLWQRGTSLASGTGKRYLADRWYNHSVGSTYTVAQQAFTLGQTDVPHEPTWFHRTVVTSVGGAANYANLRQCVESVRTLAGKSAVLSFWAKADAAKSIAVEIVQTFGSGGTPSTEVVVYAGKVTLSTAWQKFTVTASVPSISGKTLGSNDDDCLEVRFWFDAGSSFNADTATLGQQSGTFDIAQAQLEEGSAATPFERRPPAADLALCQRYYEVVEVLSRRYSTNTVQNQTSTAYKARKRAAPTTAVLGTSNTNVSSTGVGTALSAQDQIAYQGTADSAAPTKLNATLSADADF